MMKIKTVKTISMAEAVEEFLTQYYYPNINNNGELASLISEFLDVFEEITPKEIGELRDKIDTIYETIHS